MSLSSDLQQALAKIEAGAATNPAYAKALASGQQFLSDFNALLPTLVADEVGSALSTLGPLGQAAALVAVPAIKGAVTMAESVAEPWVEQALGFGKVVPTGTAVPPTPTV